LKRLFSIETDRNSNFPVNSLDFHRSSPKSTKVSVLVSLALVASAASIFTCQQNTSEVMAMTLEQSSFADIVVEQQERLVQTYESAIATARSEIKPLVTVVPSANITVFSAPSPLSTVIDDQEQMQESKRKLMVERERLRRRLAEIYANPLVSAKEIKPPSLNISTNLNVVAGTPILSTPASDYSPIHAQGNNSKHQAETAQIGFEPPAILAEVTGMIQPILFKDKSLDKPVAMNALTPLTTKVDEAGTPFQVKKLALEVNQLNSKVREAEGQSLSRDFKIVSGKIIQNLESSLGAIAKVSSSGLAPELPSLVAKVYLPDNQDYGIVSNFVWPAQGLLTSRFGWRWGRIHQGIDIAAPVGTPIWAAAPGVIDYASWNSGGYGNMIDIKHSDGTITRYAHLSAIYVKAGQAVDQSQVIAAMGSTGNSTGPHLHFEIRPNGRSAINPMNLLASVVSKS